jgi:bacterioferritin
MPSTSIDDLIRGLNEDLRGEFQAVIMYRLYASMVQGPYRQELRSFFAAEIPEELAHAQILADKISALGGTPAAEPAPVRVVAEAKEMLQAALQAEEGTLVRYLERASGRRGGRVRPCRQVRRHHRRRDPSPRRAAADARGLALARRQRASSGDGQRMSAPC